MKRWNVCHCSDFWFHSTDQISILSLACKKRNKENVSVLRIHIVLLMLPMLLHTNMNVNAFEI